MIENKAAVSAHTASAVVISSVPIGAAQPTLRSAPAPQASATVLDSQSASSPDDIKYEHIPLRSSAASASSASFIEAQASSTSHRPYGPYSRSAPAAGRAAVSQDPFGNEAVSAAAADFESDRYTIDDVDVAYIMQCS